MLDLDPVLFEQVLFNLLDNAAKYAPPGSLIRIEAREDAAAYGCRSSTKAAASPQPTSNASSTSSTACMRKTGNAPAPAWASRSAAALSRRWAERSSPRTAATGRARSSR
jgi:hypothetical protein